MKNFKPSYELLTASESVFMAMAYTETIRPKIEKIQKNLLAFWKFEVAEEHKERRGIASGAITWSNTYLMSKEDQSLLYMEYSTELKMAGFNVSPGYCPLLIAEDLQGQAEKVLLESAEYITKISPYKILCTGMENYKKAIKLTLQLCAPFVKSEKILQEL